MQPYAEDFSFAETTYSMLVENLVKIIKLQTAMQVQGADRGMNYLRHQETVPKRLLIAKI